MMFYCINNNCHYYMMFYLLCSLGTIQWQNTAHIIIVLFATAAACYAVVVVGGLRSGCAERSGTQTTKALTTISAALVWTAVVKGSLAPSANNRGMRLCITHIACLLAAALVCVSAAIEGAQENATVEHGGWIFQGTGGCSVIGEQGKYGPNLVRPRLSLRDCTRYANEAKVKVLTMYGDGFCMVQYLTRKDCLH